MAQVRVLAADRRSSAYFRQRVSLDGGVMGVKVSTFRLFYSDLLEQNGTYMPVAGRALQYRLLVQLIRNAVESGELQHYREIGPKPGFLQVMQDAFGELRSEYIQPADLAHYASGSTRAAVELAGLYRQYLARLQKIGWTDEEGQSWLAIDLLRQHPGAASNYGLIVLDGFTSFTGARLNFLKLLADQGVRIMITLPGCIGSQREVHHRAETVLEKWKAVFGDVHIQPAGSSHIAGADIARLESHFMVPAADVKPAVSQLFLEAASPAEEAREALRWIKGLVRNADVKPDECAIFTGNPSTYDPLIRTAATEFGIPVRFSHPEPLGSSAAAAAVLAFLRLPVDGYKARQVLNTLFSPFFDTGFSREIADSLERICRQYIIISGRDQWEDAWEQIAKAQPEGGEVLDDERSESNLLTGENFNALRQALIHFWELFDGIEADRSLADWIEWLTGMLGRLQFYPKLIAGHELETGEALTRVLQAMVMGENIAGTQPIPYASFLSDLKGAIDSAVQAEPEIVRRFAVIAGAMVEARAVRYRAVALLGLSEGTFPVVERADPFLDENLRSALGMESRLGREQVSIFYQAFTRADEYLLITRPYLAKTGEKQEPSPYWQAAVGLFGESGIRTIKPGDPIHPARAASIQELVFSLASQSLEDFMEDEAVSARYNAVAHGGRVLQARRARRSAGKFEGHMETLAGSLTELYPPDSIWSASRLESYGTCPFKFFAGTTLELVPVEVPEPGLKATQLGSIYHEILEQVYKRTGGGERALHELEAIAEDILDRAPRKQGFRLSALWWVERKRIVDTLRKSITKLEEDRGDWQPLNFEQVFGKEGHPELVINTGSISVRVRGVIDRVDRNSRGELRVIDYKSGGSNLDKKDFERGRRLQLPVYALAVEKDPEGGKVTGGFYWIVGQARKSSFQLETYKSTEGSGPDGVYSKLYRHLERILSGIRTGEFPPQMPRGGCPEYCPATQWCWRYHPARY